MLISSIYNYTNTWIPSDPVLLSYINIEFLAIPCNAQDEPKSSLWHRLPRKQLVNRKLVLLKRSVWVLDITRSVWQSFWRLLVRLLQSWGITHWPVSFPTTSSYNRHNYSYYLNIVVSGTYQTIMHLQLQLLHTIPITGPRILRYFQVCLGLPSR